MVGFKSCLCAAFLVGSVASAPDASRHEEGLLEAPSELVSAGAQVFANGVGALVNAGNNIGQAFGLPAFNPTDAGAAISQTVEPVVRPLKDAFGPYINSVTGLVPSTFQDAFKRSVGGLRPPVLSESSGHTPDNHHNNGGHLGVEPDVVFATATLPAPEVRRLRAGQEDGGNDDAPPPPTFPLVRTSGGEVTSSAETGSAPARATWGYYYPYSYYYGYPNYYGYWPGYWY